MIFVVICVCAAAVFAIYDSTKPSRFPPGPRFWPFVGALFLLLKLGKKSKQHEVFHKLGETYGPVVGIRLGRSPPTLVVKQDLVMEVLKREEFSGRRVDFFSESRTMGRCRGLIYGDGAKWMKHKNFTVECLRRLQTAPKYSELIHSEAERALELLKNRERGEPNWSACVLNVLSSVLLGKTFQRTDSLLELLKRATVLEEQLTETVQHSPWLQHLSAKWSGHDRFAACYTQLWLCLSEALFERKSRISAGAEPVCYLDHWILQAGEDFSDTDAVSCSMDMLIAGVYPVARLLEAFVLRMRLDPVVLERTRSELRTVNGSVTLDDLSRLNYLRSVLYEVERLTNASPSTWCHAARSDSHLGQYQVAKHFLLVMDLSSVHLDPLHWRDPLTFTPDRYRGGETPHHIPYGAGRRKCPGEDLARSMTLMIMSRVVQKLM